MKKIVLIAAGVVVALVALVLGLAATQPDTFRVERKIVIDAPTPRIYFYLSDFRAWRDWSPWEKMDPDMKRTYSEGVGLGTTYAWEGNDKVGKGKMTIVDARPLEQLRIRLEFSEPFAAQNVAEFTLVQVTGGTEVTWAMSGPNTFPGKIMSVFAGIDGMVGPDFETGLANLKAIAEQQPPPPPPPIMPPAP
ncbi:MAG: SRPBCC family protein [Pseudomonadota bacterium]